MSASEQRAIQANAPLRPAVSQTETHPRALYDRRGKGAGA